LNQTKKVRGGFTLVELMIGSTIGAVVMAGILSACTFLGRNLARLSSHQALETESRKTLDYLSRDFAVAKSVKSGTRPTASAVTLVLPAGEVTYSFDSTTRALRRQATFGSTPDLTLLHNSICECATFEFLFFTTSDGAPSDQAAPGVNVPYSIKQIQVKFVTESPSTWSPLTRTQYEVASGRYLFRNRAAPDGT
jgi:prepilin-type N-terminal cleavage/methylation domain-containing protein